MGKEPKLDIIGAMEADSLRNDMLHAFGARVDEHDDIYCLRCNKPNECCECSFEEIDEYLRHH